MGSNKLSGLVHRQYHIQVVEEKDRELARLREENERLNARWAPDATEASTAYWRKAAKRIGTWRDLCLDRIAEMGTTISMAAESARMATDRVARLVGASKVPSVGDPRNAKEFAEDIITRFHQLARNGMTLPKDREAAYADLGALIDVYADKERAAARNHAEVWMHKVEDIRVEVEQLTAERDALVARADRLAEALRRIAVEKATMSFPRNVLYELNDGRRIAREALREREEGG